MTDVRRATVHASAVALDGRGLLITGRSGAGKSSLALELMAFGARLVADDRCHLTRIGDDVTITAPDAIAGLIEARGLGLLRADHAPAVLVAVVSLDRAETRRYPLHRSTEILGLSFPEIHNSASPHFPAALLQYLKGGRKEE